MGLTAQLNRIAASLAPKIDDALGREVADAVRSKEVEAIEKTVYGAYSPKIYRRRGDMGGFVDPYNIEAKVRGGTLTVINTTEPNPGGTMNNDAVTTGKNLAALIAGGHGSGGFYDFPKRGAGFMGKRPYVEETKTALQKSKAHIRALKSGLKRLGVKSK